MNDMDKKSELPLHLIFGASDHTKMNFQVMPRIGQLGEPVGELTRFGWVLMSPRKEAKTNKLMCMKVSMIMKISGD